MLIIFTNPRPFQGHFDIIECQPFKTNQEMSAFRKGACVLQQSFDEIK